MTRLLALPLLLVACTPIKPLDTFPTAPHQPPAEVEAELPAAQKAFAQAYPTFEIVQFASTGDDFGYTRNELSGTVTGRMLEAHVQFRHGGQCYYTKPAFLEEHVDTAWGPPHVVELRFPQPRQDQFYDYQWVENVKVTRMASCAQAGATTANR